MAASLISRPGCAPLCSASECEAETLIVQMSGKEKECLWRGQPALGGLSVACHSRKAENPWLRLID